MTDLMTKPAKPSHRRALVVRGDMRRLWTHRDLECLADGPAGTGKSWGICCRLVALCLQNPGIRVLLARKTRASMSQSILVTWERVLDFFGQGEVYAGAGRGHRSAYRFANGSEVAVLGFDDPERVKSSEFDLLYVNEATELSVDDWEIATSRLRHNKMGWHQAVADCNPGAPNHWLNRRAMEGGPMVRLLTRHQDNPALHDGTDWTEYGKTYLDRLGTLSGARRSRLLLGLWVAAEGAVFEETWDAKRHVIDAVDPATLRGYFATVDWGYRDPGVIQVWGYDGDKRLYRVREVYRSERTIKWWEAQARCIRRDYAPSVFICDPSQPAHIEQFVKAGIPARGADRSQVKQQDLLMPTPLKGSIEVGLRRMEERLRENRIAYVRGATGEYAFPSLGDGEPDYTKPGEWRAGRDERLAASGHPVCTEDEFPLYAYPKNEEGKVVKELPLDLYNHGIDCGRYACQYADTLSVNLDSLQVLDTAAF